jgi:hypothetical protein
MEPFFIDYRNKTRSSWICLGWDKGGKLFEAATLVLFISPSEVC